jgi:hypothetical protein
VAGGRYELLAFAFGEGFFHAGRDSLLAVDAAFAGDDVFALAVDETDHGVVPRGFAVFLEKGGFATAFVVTNHEGDEVVLDGLHDGGIAEDFGPEVATSTSSGDFLEKEEDGFSCFLGKSEGGIVVGLPGDFAEFDLLVDISGG